MPLRSVCFVSKKKKKNSNAQKVIYRKGQTTLEIIDDISVCNNAKCILCKTWSTHRVRDTVYALAIVTSGTTSLIFQVPTPGFGSQSISQSNTEIF